MKSGDVEVLLLLYVILDIESSGFITDSKNEHFGMTMIAGSWIQFWFSVY